MTIEAIFLANRDIMEHKQTIYAAVVKELFDEVIRRGISVVELEQRTGLRPEDLEDMDARVPLDQFIKLWEAAIDLSGDPTLALKIGEQSRPENMGAIGLVFLNSTTLEEMLETIKRYVGLVSESDTLELRIKGDKFHYIYSIAPLYMTIPGIERSLSTAVTFARIFTDQNLSPLQVRFQHAPPAYQEEYQRIFRAPVLFDQPDNAIVFPKSLLSLKFENHNPYLRELLEKHIDSLLETLASTNSFQKHVHSLIIENLPKGEIGVDWIADQLNMSRRTLTRKLRQEGISFQEMLDNTRKNIAIHCLRQEQYTINDMTFLLGFSEPSSFSRAFKQWTGQAPGVYRQSILANT